MDGGTLFTALLHILGAVDETLVTALKERNSHLHSYIYGCTEKILTQQPVIKDCYCDAKGKALIMHHQRSLRI